MAWSAEDLKTFGDAEEVRIAPVRADGTVGRGVIIWIVRLGDDLYVRSANGREGAWFRAALARHEGRLSVGSRQRDVRFVDVGLDMDAALEAEYRSKYRRYENTYVKGIINDKAKAATLKVLPR